MPMTDIFAAALSRPAMRAFEGPLRNLILEVIDERGYGSPAELLALKQDLRSVRDAVRTATSRLDQAQQLHQELLGRIQELQHALASSNEALQRARVVADEAESRASEAERRSDRLEARVAELEDARPAGIRASTQPTRHGFAVSEYHLWMAGTLPNVVSPEGLLSIGGSPFRVGMEHAGKRFSLDPEQQGIVCIDGEPVSPSPL